jgi:hypothetical protein
MEAPKKSGVLRPVKECKDFRELEDTTNGSLVAVILDERAVGGTDG